MKEIIKYIIQHFELFLSEYKDSVAGLDIDCKFFKVDDLVIRHIKERKYLLFFAAFLCEQREASAKLLALCGTKAHDKELRKEIEETFIGSLKFALDLGIPKIAAALLYSCIKLYPEDYLEFMKYFVQIEDNEAKLADFNPLYLKVLKCIGPQIFRKYNYHVYAIDSLLKEPNNGGIRNFLDVLNRIVTKDDCKINYILQLMKTRKKMMPSICSLVSELPFILFTDCFNVL